MYHAWSISNMACLIAAVCIMAHGGRGVLWWLSKWLAMVIVVLVVNTAEVSVVSVKTVVVLMVRIAVEV